MDPSEELRAINAKIDKLNSKIENAMLGKDEYKDVTDQKIDRLIVELKTQLADLEGQRDRWFKLVEAVEMKKGILICVFIMQFLQK